MPQRVSVCPGLLRQIGVSRDKADFETEYPANLLQGGKRRICLSSFNLSDLPLLQEKHSGKFGLRHAQAFPDLNQGIRQAQIRVPCALGNFTSVR